MRSAGTVLEERSRLLLELSKLQSAGIDTAKSFSILAQGSAHQSELEKIARECGGGMPVWQALNNSSLLAANDITLIRAIENTGDLQNIYTHLGNTYAQARNRLNQITSRLYMPFAVLILGLIASSLPSLIAGTIGPGSLIFRVLVPVIIILILYRYISHLAVPSEDAGMTRRLLTGIPFLARRFYQSALSNVLSSLGTLLHAGLPAAEAVMIAGKTAGSHPQLEKKCQCISRQLSKGRSLAQGFDSEQLIDDVRLNALIHTGEESGKLPSMIDQCAGHIQQWLDLQTDVIAEWLPRVVYILVAGWVASTLF